MPIYNFQPIRLLDPDGYKFTYLMGNSADPDQFRHQLIWIGTVCKGRVYQGSAGLGLLVKRGGWELWRGGVGCKLI